MKNSKNIKLDSDGDVGCLIELYKLQKECFEKSKRNALETYRIYVPVIFGLLIAISKINTLNIIKDFYSISIFIVPILELFLLATYIHIIYDLTDMACISVHLKYLEDKINESYGGKIIFWENEFSDALKIIEPVKLRDKLIRYISLVLVPATLCILWLAIMWLIFGFNRIFLAYSATFILAIVFITYFVGVCRLRLAESFVEDHKK